MIPNALGFVRRALYLVPVYLRNKPIDLFIDPALCAEDFNDDSLGRSLDGLYRQGGTEVFVGVASRALDVYEIDHHFVHLDSAGYAQDNLKTLDKMRWLMRVPESLDSVWVDITRTIQKIEIPVLIIHGAEDRILSPDQSRKLFSLLHSPRDLKLVDGSGHALHLDRKKDAVYTLIARWVRKYLFDFNLPSL